MGNEDGARGEKEEEPNCAKTAGLGRGSTWNTVERELRKVIANEGRHEFRQIADLIGSRSLKSACLADDKGDHLISSDNYNSFIMLREALLKLLMKLEEFDRLV